MSVVKKVFKYNLDIKYSYTLELPVDAEILSFDMHAGLINLWALVDPLVDKEIRKFEIYRTGEDISDPDNKFYIDTVKDAEIGDVYHIFEVR